MEEDEDSHSRLLVTKIRESFDHPAFSDIQVKSEGKVFYAHKIILNTRGGGWVEQNLTNKQVLDLSCHEDKVVERILKWIYCGSSLVTIEDSQEFKIKILKASTKLSLTDAENLCKKLIASRNEIKMQIHQEIIKKGVIKSCGTCIGCQTPDCQICRFCQDMKKYGGEGKLRQKCKLRRCSAQIQTKNLRRLNQASKESDPKFNKTDPNVTDIDDVIGLCSDQFATQRQTQGQVSERILTDISGVAPVNDSRSVETQDTVILTATGSRPNSRASNTFPNTPEMDTVILTAQEEPSSSKTLNASINQIPENLGEDDDTVGHGRIKSVDEEDRNQNSPNVSKKRKERPLSDSEESDGEEDKADDKEEVDKDEIPEDDIVKTKKIAKQNLFDKKGKLTREFCDIEDGRGEDKKVMDLFEMEEGDLDENDEEAEIEKVRNTVFFS